MTTLYDSVNTVLKRLDDYPTVSGEQAYTRAEIELYLQDGHNVFCRQTKCILDFYYAENIAQAGNYVAAWELGYYQSGMIAVGLLGYTGGYWERDYAVPGATGPANLTQPWEYEYLSTTFAVSRHSGTCQSGRYEGDMRGYQPALDTARSIILTSMHR